MPPSVSSGGEHDDRSYRFLRRPRTPVVVEEKLPRRSPEDELAAIARRSEVEEAVEMDNQQGKHRAKIIVGIVAFCVVVAVIVDVACHDNVQNWLDESFDWIEENPKAGERQTQGWAVQASFTRVPRSTHGVDLLRCCGSCVAVRDSMELLVYIKCQVYSVVYVAAHR